MENNINERKLITQSFNFLRILQQEIPDNKKNVEQIRHLLNMSRAMADKVKDSLIEANVISQKLTITPYFATFIGISVSYSEIEFSVIGMDGKVIPWTIILSQTKNNFEGFDGKLNFNYSSSELMKISTFINELVCVIKSVFSIKAICISFDDVDLKNGTFSLTDYFTEYSNSTYSFYDFCTICFSEIQKDITILLDCNAMCQLVSEEFPLLKRDYNSLYFNIEQNGCFASLISCNTARYGYNMQTLNLSGVLTNYDKKSLASNDVTDSELLSICTKILKSLIIPLTPEWIYISGKTVSQNAKLSSLLSFQKSEVFGSCIARNYNPTIKLLPNSMSKGAAIMAMYRYYGWDYTCV